MKIHRDIGPGLDEAIYQNSCEEEFINQGIQHEPQASRWIMHRDQRVKELIPDFLIEDKFILDLKAIFGDLPKAAYTQILCYCKLFEVRLGMLADFGNQSLDWKRLVHDSEPDNLDLDSTLSTLSLTKKHQSACQAAVKAISTIWHLHGPGYTDDIYKLLLQVELKYQEIDFEIDPTGEIAGRTINKLPLILIDSLCPIYVIALHEKPTATHLARMRTYLKCLNLPCGYLINFGRRSAQVIGVQSPKK